MYANNKAYNINNFIDNVGVESMKLSDVIHEDGTQNERDSILEHLEDRFLDHTYSGSCFIPHKLKWIRDFWE